MTDFLSVTMNPSVDVYSSTERVTCTHKLRCEAPVYRPGGGGINVVRVAHRLGSDCVALYPAGGATGQRLKQLLDHEQIPTLPVPVQGETRECFTVHENSTGAEFRFVTPGSNLNVVEWQTCLDQLMAIDPWPAFIVASGSLPPGVPIDFYARLSKAARLRGSRLILDSSGPALAQGLNSGVFLVKPSLRELSDWFGQSLTTPDQWQAAALKLLKLGHAEVVLVSLGEQGAMMVSNEGTVFAPALAVKVVSTVAAGDTLVGAMVHALTRKMNLRDALTLGLACASAALLSHGHCLFEKAHLDRLLGQVRLQEI